MKKLLIFLCLCLTLNILFSTETIDFIIAKVGREIILLSDLIRQISQMRNAQMWDERMTEMDVLESLIENKLIVLKARELNIRADDRRINMMVDNQIAQIRASFTSEEEFIRELRSAGMVLSDLRQYYDDMLREQFLRDRLIQTEIRNKIHITDNDIYLFYLEEKENLPERDISYELAMILRLPRPSAETDRLAQEKINDIKQRLENEEDFATLASEFSDCPSGQYGGDLGFFTRGMMVEEFDRAAFALEIDQVSEIIKTGFGYHIIKLTDKRGSEIQASHILVMVEESEIDIENEREFMQSIRNRIITGEAFSDLATEYSQDERSQTNNGVLGALTHQEFPPWFINDLRELDLNEISEVLEYQNALYLFTINKIFEPRPFEFEEIKEQLNEMLLTRKQYELYEHWVENLKQEIYVEVFEDKLSVFKQL